jgi:predicted ATPase/DNA-binding SARP family transcriptional activator
MIALRIEPSPVGGTKPIIITLFGSPQITVVGRVLTLARRQARALLYRVAAASQPVPRDQLGFLLWPDVPETTARRNLTVLLSQVRQALPATALISTSSGIALDPALAEVDVAVASALAAAGLRQGDLDQLAAAADLYRGPFLDGLVLPDADEFQSWLTQERQAWERWYLDLLNALVEGYTAAGQYPPAIAAAQRALAADPLAEEVHRRLIELYGLLGDRGAAARQFERCVAILEQELGAAPLPATRAAYEAVRDGQNTGAGRAQPPTTTSASGGEQRRPAIPAPSSPLIGRTSEIATLLGVLERGDARLLTLTGIGGSGKTRLALEVLARASAQLPDEIFFVPLALLHDTALLLDAIARACGVEGFGTTTTAAALIGAFHGRRVLLALDNFEHLLPALPQLAELLRDLPGLRLLVTSRSLLHLSGEQVFPVTPLPVPDLANLPPPEALAGQPAVALLLARTQAGNHQFALTPENAADLAAICVRLDGLPLALELAAARLRLMAPRSLLQRLEQRLSLLSQGARDLPERQRSLRGVIAWSYELLNVREQRLFERLAAFAGSWSIDAAEQLASEPGQPAPDDAIDDLTALVDASLVQQTVGVGGEPRLQLLETVRLFAQEQLQGRGAAQDVAERHMRLYAERAAQIAPQLRAADAPRWLDWVEDDEPNMLAALDHAAASGDDGAALQLFSALLVFWSFRGHLHQGHHWIERAFPLARPASRAEPDSEHVLRAQAQFEAGNLYFHKGENALARDLLAASVAWWRALERPERHAGAFASALGTLGVIAELSGDHARAAVLMAEVESLVATTGDSRAHGQQALNRGVLARFGGRPWEARGHLSAALGFYRHVGDLEFVSIALLNLTPVLLVLGDEAGAEALADEALALGRRLKSQTLVANVLNDLGEIARYRGADELAHAYYSESLTLLRRMGNRNMAPRLLHNLGQLALRQGDYGHAGQHFAESLRLFSEQGLERGMLEGLIACGSLAAARDMPLLAAQLWGAAEHLAGQPGLDLWPPDQLAYAAALAQAHATSSSEAFAAARQQGRSLTWAAARALAEQAGALE